jgi:hypothetical protein
VCEPLRCDELSTISSRFAEQKGAATKVAESEAVAPQR